MRNFRALSRDLSPFSTVSSVRGLAFAVLLLSPFLSPPSFCRPFDFVDPSDRGILLWKHPQSSQEQQQENNLQQQKQHTAAGAVATRQSFQKAPSQSLLADAARSGGSSRRSKKGARGVASPNVVADSTRVGLESETSEYGLPALDDEISGKVGENGKRVRNPRFEPVRNDDVVRLKQLETSTKFVGFLHDKAIRSRMPVLHSVLWETPWLPVSRQDYFRPDGRYLFITGSRDYCAGVKHFHLSLTCLIAEAAYLNRTLILDMTQCVNAWHSGGMHHIRSIHVYYDLDSLRTVPFTPLQGFLRGAREWQVQERRAGRDGAIRARVVDERAPMAALAADGATPVVIRETNYGFSTCKVGGNGCRWVRLSVGGAGGGYPCACGGCAYGRGWSYSSGYPRNNGCRWAELGVSKTAIWFRPELLALAANISPPPTPPSSPPPTSPLQRQDTPAGVSETAIRFRPELLALAANISASMNGGDFDAVHVRRGDKLRPEFWPHLDHDTRPDA
ncbi:unnamed protein product [Closterium sp. NIES-64]|nr:unnamed protein product [Closterium sp. NIES-64]